LPIVHLNSFRLSVKQVWKWDDTDDAGLVAFMTAGRPATCNNFTVDRADTTTLQWQKYQYSAGGYIPTGVYDSVPLVIGDHLDPKCPYPYPTPSGPGVRDMAGVWECDQYGLPFNLDDLLAQ